MDFREVLKRRRMVRHFVGEPISSAVRDRIIDAGLRAPSAGYSQGYRLLIAESREDLDTFWAIHNPSPPGGWSTEILSGVHRSPLVISVLASKNAYLDRYAEPDKGFTDRDETRWSVPYWYVDAGCVALLLLLAAVDEGLGALLFGFEPEDVPRFRKAFGVPDDYDLVGSVAVGRADPTAPMRDLTARRLPRTELVRYGHWSRGDQERDT